MSDIGMRRPQYNDNTVGTGNRDPWNNPVKDDRGSNGNNNNNSNSNNQNNNSNNNSNSDDKNLINEDMINNIWDKVTNTNNNNNNNNNNNSNGNNNNNNNNNSNPTKSAQEQMDDYIKSIGLEPFILTDAEKEKIQSGDWTGLLQKIHQQTVQAHMKALSGSQTMIDKAVKDAVEKVKTDTQNAKVSEMELNSLHNALPWTKEKAFSPVAQAAMQRFRARGLSVEDSIVGVEKYFDAMFEKANAGKVNKNRNQNFGANPRSDADGTPEGGWVNFLTGRDGN